MLASLPAEPAASSFRRLSSNISNADTELQQKPGVQQQGIAAGTTQQRTPETNQTQRSLEPQAPQGTLAAEVNKLLSGKKAAPAISVLCRHFTLGKLRSDFPSRVEAFTDRLEYFFKHPSHGRVRMVMYYRDFGTVTVKKTCLVFKIMTILDMFTAHYNPAEPQHMLGITFDSAIDLQQIQQAIQQGMFAYAAA
ncbi:hypothetical protein WJX77_004914 [Trebouxia sp. C0004]